MGNKKNPKPGDIFYATIKTLKAKYPGAVNFPLGPSGHIKLVVIGRAGRSKHLWRVKLPDGGLIYMGTKGF